MKVNTSFDKVESDGITNPVERFSIGDPDFVLEILRNKLYSNIKKAICQEYASNARDAHRETGNESTPIEITLPTYLEPYWKCRDFGPGISPDRINNVFIRYGVSTKRTSDTFTGGFGIGCKSGFGYSDTFLIKTFIDGTARSYSAIIDQLFLLSELPTEEPNGTEISIPVKPEDFDAFIHETQVATQHWDVMPVIKAGVINYPDYSKLAVLSGTDWFLTKDRHGDRRVNLIIDGIQYPCNKDMLPQGTMPSFGYSTTIYLKFPVGVMSISANRESVEMDDRTMNAIVAALAAVKAEVRSKFTDAVNQATTYLEANLAFHQIVNALSIDAPSDVTWNGKKVHGRQARVDGTVTTYKRQTVYTNGKSRETAVKNGDSNSYIVFDKDTVYCLSDMPGYTARGPAAILRAFPGKETVMMVKMHDWADKDYLEKSSLDQLDFVNLSKYYTPITRESSGLGRLTFYKFNTARSKFERSSVKAFEEDRKLKAWTTISRRNPQDEIEIKTSNGNTLSRTLGSIFDDLTIFDGYSVYGFMSDLDSDRVEEVTEDMVHIEDLVKEYITNRKISLAELYAVEVSSYSGTTDMFGTNAEVFIRDLKKAGASALTCKVFEYVENYKAATREHKSMQKHTVLLRFIKEDTAAKQAGGVNVFEALNKEIIKEYPLFPMINMRYGLDRHDIAKVVNYILMVDNVRNHAEENPPVTFGTFVEETTPVEINLN